MPAGLPELYRQYLSRTQAVVAPQAAVGTVLTARTGAWQAAQAAVASAEERWGSALKALGRGPSHNLELLEALIGTDRTTKTFQQAVAVQETPFGPMFGISRAGKAGGAAPSIDWLPTQWGPYVITPTDTGAALKITGVRGRLEYSKAMAQEVQSNRAIRHLRGRSLRSWIMRFNTGFSGSAGEDAATMYPALGHMYDYLKANRAFSPEMAAELVGDYPGMKEAQKAVSVAQGLGLYPALSNAASIQSGIASLMSLKATRPLGGAFASHGRQLYQNLAYAPILSASAIEQEMASFGGTGRMLPRLRTKEMATVERAFSGGVAAHKRSAQTFISRVAFLDEESQLFKKLARGLPEGTEQVLISRRLKHLQYVSGGSVHRVGIGTAFMGPGGQKIKVGGYIEDVVSQGLDDVDVLIAGALAKDQDRRLQMTLQDAIYQSLNLETGRVPRGVSQTLSHYGIGRVSTTGAGIERRGGLITFTPGPALKEGSRLGTAVRRMLRAMQKLKQKKHIQTMPFAPERIQGIGIVRKGIAEMGIRAEMSLFPSLKGLRVNPMDMMGMASMGPSSEYVARQVLNTAIRKGGARAQSMFAIFNPFLGRDLPANMFGPGKYQRVSAKKTSASLIKGLKSVRSIEDLSHLVSKIPDYDMALQFSRDIHIPTAGFFNPNASERVKAMYRTRELALPSIRNLRGLLEGLTAKGADPESAAFIPEYARGVGRVLEEAYKFEMGTGSEARLQAAVFGRNKGLAALIARHSGKGGMLSERIFARAMPGAYAGLLEGIGKGGLPAVDIGELGMSYDLFYKIGRKAGMQPRQIRRRAKELWAARGSLLADRREMFVGGQFYPGVTPETSRVFKLKLFTPEETRGLGKVARGQVATNVADRLAAFRDLDFDAMVAYFFGKGFRHKRLRSAWAEQKRRQSLFAKTVEAARLAYGNTATKDDIDNLLAKAGKLSAGEVHKLLGQKLITPKSDPTTRLIQETLQNKFGARSADAMRAIGHALQVGAVKKGQAGTMQGLIDELEGIGSVGSIEDSIRAIAGKGGILEAQAKRGLELEAPLGLPRNRYRATAEQLVAAAQDVAGLSRTQKARRLSKLTSGKSKDLFGLLTALTNIEPATQDPRGPLREWFASAMMRFGRVRGESPGKMEVAAKIAAQNAEEKAAGAAAKAEGGLARKLWANMPLPGKIAAGVVGGLIGLRMVKSALVGDEPAPTPMPSSAPLPPSPIGMPGGYHDSLAAAPMASFSPPQARIISPMQRSPSVTMTGTAPQGMNLAALGDRIASAAHSPVGAPLAGVFSSGISGPSRIDMNIAEELRSQNRLYM